MKKVILFKHAGRGFPNNKIYYSGSVYANHYNTQNTFKENATVFSEDQSKECSTRISKTKWQKEFIE